MMHEVTLSGRVERVLLAACAGDALGAATEGMHPDQIVEVFGGPVMTLSPPPPKAPFALGLAPGSLTDDATQMLVMARMLVKLDRAPMLADAVEGLMTWADDEEMFRRFAGPTTRLAVERLRGGTPPLEVATPDVYSCTFGTSNGAAMRAPAAGCARIGDLAGAAELACLLAAPTHNTQIAYEGAGAVAAAVAAGLSGASGGVSAIIDAGLDGAGLGAAQAPVSGRLAGGVGVKRRLALAAEIGERFAGDMDGAVHELTEVIGNGVAMAEAVPHAFGLVAAAEGDPWKAIVAAVNGGNDSDTIAMIAGAIAAAWWPDDAVPTGVANTVKSVNDLDLAPLAAGLVTLGKAGKAR
jgi:ADP-ribosylglycohydrolase